jgi:hypothetical protein
LSKKQGGNKGGNDRSKRPQPRRRK